LREDSLFSYGMASMLPEIITRTFHCMDIQGNTMKDTGFFHSGALPTMLAKAICRNG